MRAKTKPHFTVRCCNESATKGFSATGPCYDEESWGLLGWAVPLFDQLAPRMLLPATLLQRKLTIFSSPLPTLQNLMLSEL